MTILAPSDLLALTNASGLAEPESAMHVQYHLAGLSTSADSRYHLCDPWGRTGYAGNDHTKVTFPAPLLDMTKALGHAELAAAHAAPKGRLLINCGVGETFMPPTTEGGLTHWGEPITKAEATKWRAQIRLTCEAIVERVKQVRPGVKVGWLEVEPDLCRNADYYVLGNQDDWGGDNELMATARMANRLARMDFRTTKPRYALLRPYDGQDTVVSRERLQRRMAAARVAGSGVILWASDPAQLSHLGAAG
jgi:hypothetical protein